MGLSQTQSNFKGKLKYAWACLGSRTDLGKRYLSFVNKKNNDQSVIILMYHRVINPEKCRDIFSTSQITVTKDTFEKQIKFLSNHYKLLSLEEFYGYHSNGKPLPAKTAVITFDDGWEDNYLNAFPILKKYKVPATIFLTTGFIGETFVFWQEKLRFLLKEFLIKSFDERRFFLEKFKNLPGTLKSCMALNDKSAIVDLPDNLMDMPEKDRTVFMNDLEEFLGFPEFPIKTNGFMTWENAREMLKDKIDFGSHTKNHKIMTKLSAKEIHKEITVSKIKIEKELNIQVRAFAYPNGYFNKIVMENVKKGGYRYAVSVDTGLNNIHTNPYCLRRLNINEIRFLKPGGGFSEDLFSARLCNWL